MTIKINTIQYQKGDEFINEKYQNKTRHDARSDYISISGCYVHQQLDHTFELGKFLIIECRKISSGTNMRCAVIQVTCIEQQSQFLTVHVALQNFFSQQPLVIFSVLMELDPKMLQTECKDTDFILRCCFECNKYTSSTSTHSFCCTQVLLLKRRRQT